MPLCAISISQCDPQDKTFAHSYVNMMGEGWLLILQVSYISVLSTLSCARDSDLALLPWHHYTSHLRKWTTHKLLFLHQLHKVCENQLSEECSLTTSRVLSTCLFKFLTFTSGSIISKLLWFCHCVPAFQPHVFGCLMLWLPACFSRSAELTTQHSVRIQRLKFGCGWQLCEQVLSQRICGVICWLH